MSTLRRIILALALIAGIAPAVAQVPGPVPALPDTERRTAYSITASTCNCGVGFALYADSNDFQNWLEVWLNGTRVNFNDATFGWTITSPTGSLGSIALPITNAILTFNSAQTGTVQIVGARRPRRTSQFNEGNGVPTRNFNVVLSDLTAQNREIWDKTNDMTGRGLFGPPGQPNLGPLPTLALRSGALLAFDGNGNPVAVKPGVGTGNVVGPSSSVNGDLACWNGTSGGLLSDCGNAVSAGSVSFTQSGTGAVPISVDNLLRNIVITPEMFGDHVACSTASGAGIQLAINFIGTVVGAGRVQGANCIYPTVGTITIQYPSVSLEGYSSGTGLSSGISFTPTGVNQCALLLSAGASILSNVAVKNIKITTADTTTYKKGLCISDGSVSTVDNVYIENFFGGTSGTITGAANSGTGEIRLTVANASTLFNNGFAVAVSGVVGTTEANTSWPIVVVSGNTIDLKGSKFTNAYVSGGTITASSTAIQIAGRELCQFNNIAANGDLPLRISPNPNTSGGIEALDECNFNNMSLGSATGTNSVIMIDTGALPSSVKFGGTQSWGGGFHGITWFDNSSAAITTNISFDHVRREQPSVAGGTLFNLQPNNSVYSVSIRDAEFAGGNGILARNIRNLQIDNPNWLASSGVCLDIDSSVTNTQINGGYWLTGSSTANLAGQTLLMATGINPSGGCLPSFAIYANAAVVNKFGPSSFALSSDATGDIFYRNSSGNLARLPIGSTGNALTVTGGLPAWSGTVGAVSSVFGRTGAVVAATNDYSLAQVSGTLQAAQEPAHTGDVTNTAGSLALAYTNVVPAAKGGAGTINGVLSGNGSGVVSQGATTGLSDTTGDTAWTPTDASGAGLTFTAVTARYTKVGKSVTAIVRLTYPTTANTVSASIGGLPVATSPNYPASGGVTAGSCFFTGATNAILAPLIISSSTSLVALANNAGALALNSTLSAQTLLCTFTYIST